MRKCSVNGCRKDRARLWPMCMTHWNQVPPRLRTKILGFAINKDQCGCQEHVVAIRKALELVIDNQPVASGEERAAR